MDLYVELSKDIINLINNYCDISQEHLYKIYNKNKHKIKPIIEISENHLIKALQNGFSGFYIYGRNDDNIIKFKNLFKNYNKIKVFRWSPEFIYVSLDIPETLCSIERLI